MRTAVVSGQLAGEVAGEAAVNVEKVTGLNFDLLSLSEKEAGKALDLLSAPDHLPAWTEDGAIKTASTILDIINRYRLKRPSTISSDSKEGNLAFLATICSHVRAGQEVVMCLPAFPFKSPNSTTKVLGKLPDRAEEIALAHLNGLCQAITDVYPPGAKLTIISDGLVYNDLLGVPDKDVWAYGESLRAMASDRGFKHIAFSRLRDLVPTAIPDQMDEMMYVANATNFRRGLLNLFGRSDWDWKVASQSEDVCLTYRGYIKFLETDLQNVYPLHGSRSKSKYKRGIECIAKEMLARGNAFATAVGQKYKNHVRLSIHPSRGATKLPISLLPTTTMYTTPWHSSVALKLDGTLVSGMRSEFEKDAEMELVYEDGRPSYFRQKSDLFSWGEEKGGITAKPLYPCGWLLQPSGGPGALSIQDIDGQKVRQLSEINSPVVMRGFFANPQEQRFMEKSSDFGQPVGWKFGILLKVKDAGVSTGGLNNVLSAEWMPFHYDGIFKTTRQLDESGKEVLVPTPPRFQFFAGATEAPKDTGFTLFSSSTLIFKYLPDWLGSEVLSGMTWSVSTPSFDECQMKGLPLVVRHPSTGKPCLRYHEPWPQSKTRFEPTLVTMDGQSEEGSGAICDVLDSLLHDRRVVYYHAWEKGDLVVSDNTLMMHTRSSFTSDSERELWRIHFD